VCGVDRSRASRLALESALALCQDAGSRLIVVHVLADMNDEERSIAEGHHNSPECWSHVEPAIRASYAQLIPEEVRQRCQVELRTPIGNPSTEILNIVKENHADLVVIGATGWRGGRDVTRHVLRHTPSDALVVPHRSSRHA
jgi:nucleotide-binding universal stress UspA family protein